MTPPKPKSPEVQALQEKLAKLYDKLREAQEKQYAITEEIGQLISGNPGIGSLLKAAEARMGAVWGESYHTPYLWDYKRDRPNLKRLLVTLGLEELVVRWSRYLQDPEPYYARARHPLALFLNNVNRYADAQAESFTLDVAAPADCKHVPRCRTDQEHTQRRMNDLVRPIPVTVAR